MIDVSQGDDFVNEDGQSVERMRNSEQLPKSFYIMKWTELV